MPHERVLTPLEIVVHPLCTVVFSVDRSKLWLEKSFKGPVDRKKHRNAVFQMYILLGSAGLDFCVSYRNEVVGHVEAKYLQKFD